MAKKNFYIKQSQLDDYQMKVIERRTDNSFVVKGCAGSGKSILALWKLKQIVDNNLGSYLFIVKTKTLSTYMHDGLKELNIPIDNVHTYNKCFHWTKDDNDNWQRGDWKLGNVDYIIVDEAQDFAQQDISILNNQARKALMLYGDSAQQLYSFDKTATPMSIEQIVAQFDLPMEQLVFNHRLPKKIARVAQVLNCSKDDIETRCTEEGSELPKIFKHNSIEAQLDQIAEIIKNRNLDDVGILFAKNNDVTRAHNYLTNKGLSVESKTNDNIDLDFTSTNPKIMTYHSSKGLQFETVFIPECNSQYTDGNNALYVAMTRSHKLLYIMHSGQIAAALQGLDTSLYESGATQFEEL